MTLFRIIGTLFAIIGILLLLNALLDAARYLHYSFAAAENKAIVRKATKTKTKRGYMYKNTLEYPTKAGFSTFTDLQCRTKGDTVKIKYMPIDRRNWLNTEARVRVLPYRLSWHDFASLFIAIVFTLIGLVFRFVGKHLE